MVSTYAFNSIDFQIESDTELISTIYTERIQAFFDKVVEPTQTIESLIGFNNGELSRQEFDNLAKSFYDEDYMIGIGYVPNGINTYVYPYESNSKIVGQNVFDDSLGGKDATTAYETNQTVTSGPFVSPTGSVTIAVRNPIYIDDEFWGFSAVAVEPVKMIENEISIQQLNSIGYEFSLHSNYNGYIVSLYETENFDVKWASKYSFSVGKSLWTLELYNDAAINNKNVTVALILFVTFITLMFIYGAVSHYYNKNTQMKKDVYCDALTKLNNRKFLNEVIAKRNKYTLFYIDLNNFKPINDNYSHEMGDFVLIEYAKRLQASFRERTSVFRLGGDEFAVAIEAILEEHVKENIVERIKKAAEGDFTFKGDTVHISASVGVAVYPDDGSSLQDVMTVADKKMYIDKKKMKGG